MENISANFYELNIKSIRIPYFGDFVFVLVTMATLAGKSTGEEEQLAPNIT